MITVKRVIFIALLGLSVNSVYAKEGPFYSGPLIKEFGQIASVESDMAIPANTKFKVVFDASQAAGPDKINQTMNTAARFINMHVEAGVPVENINIAIVTHGGASIDLTNQAYYKSRKDNHANATAAAIDTLLKHHVDIYLCGQSAAAHGITKDNLLPGIKMALSAMTAHALLQQSGYTPNPF